MPLGDLSRALPGLVVLCLLLAIWLGWSGVRQWRDADRSEALQQARDAGVAALESAYRDQIAQLTRRMSSDAVKTALGSGDPAVATEAILAAASAVAAVGVLVLPGYQTSYDNRHYIPADVPSNVGYAAAEQHFGSARMNPDMLMVGIGSLEVANFVTQVRNRGADAFVVIDDQNVRHSLLRLYAKGIFTVNTVPSPTLLST